MSVTQQTLAVGRGLAATRPVRRAWHAGLQGSELTWAIAFAVFGPIPGSDCQLLA